MREELHTLRVANCLLAIILDLAKVVGLQNTCAESAGEYVCGGHGILQSDIDPNTSDGRHRVGCISNAQKPGSEPALKMVDLNRKQFDLVPAFDLSRAAH